MSTLNVEQVNTIGVTVDGVAVSGKPGYNYIINGNFDVWQRGTSQTTSGYGSADRWRIDIGGTSCVHSKQSFAIGGAFPDGKPTPRYYSQTVVSSVASTSNYCSKGYRIEYVSTLAGKKAILSFYAKADSTKDVALEFMQSFGTGGTPSATINSICVQKVTLTQVWQRFVITLDIPSISGKVLGTDGNDCLIMNIWLDAGSNWNSRANSLGQQSGTFDIAAVSLVEGDKDIKPIPRSYGEELALCQRYYYTSRGILASLEFGGSFAINNRSFPVTMRATPVMTVTADGGTGGSFIAGENNTFYQSSLNSVASGATIKADAEL